MTRLLPEDPDAPTCRGRPRRSGGGALKEEEAREDPDHITEESHVSISLCDLTRSVTTSSSELHHRSAPQSSFKQLK